jgi:hypothetical protein
MFEHG